MFLLRYHGCHRNINALCSVTATRAMTWTHLHGPLGVQLTGRRDEEVLSDGVVGRVVVGRLSVLPATLAAPQQRHVRQRRVPALKQHSSRSCCWTSSHPATHQHIYVGRPLIQSLTSTFMLDHPHPVTTSTFMLDHPHPVTHQHVHVGRPFLPAQCVVHIYEQRWIRLVL